jgi:hypothetical protein
MVGNFIRVICRAPKSRAGCHFAAAIGLRSLLEDYAPTSRLGQRSTHTRPEKAGARSRTLPQGRREVDSTTDRRRSLRGRSLPAVGDQAAGPGEAMAPGPRGRQYRATYSKTVRCTRTRIRLASGLGCMSKRTSIMLEEVIKHHWFAGISPEQSFTEAGRHCEAVVAAD